MTGHGEMPVGLTGFSRLRDSQMSVSFFFFFWLCCCAPSCFVILGFAGTTCLLWSVPFFIFIFKIFWGSICKKKNNNNSGNYSVNLVRV